MEVLTFTLQYAWPLVIGGVCILGWIKFWQKPDYVFAAIYSVGILGCFWFAGIFAPFQPLLVYSVFGIQLSIDRFTARGIVVASAFFLVAVVIVTIRQWLKARKGDRSNA